MLTHENKNLVGYLDGGLSPAAQERVERHLAACSRCRATLAELRAARAALEAAGHDAPLPAHDAELWARVRTQIAPDGIARPVARQRPRWAITAGALGFTVVAATVVLFVNQPAKREMATDAAPQHTTGAPANSQSRLPAPQPDALARVEDRPEPGKNAPPSAGAVPSADLPPPVRPPGTAEGRSADIPPTRPERMARLEHPFGDPRSSGTRATGGGFGGAAVAPDQTPTARAGEAAPPAATDRMLTPGSFGTLARPTPHSDDALAMSPDRAAGTTPKVTAYAELKAEAPAPATPKAGAAEQQTPGRGESAGFALAPRALEVVAAPPPPESERAVGAVVGQTRPNAPTAMRKADTPAPGDKPAGGLRFDYSPTEEGRRWFARAGTAHTRGRAREANAAYRNALKEGLPPTEARIAHLRLGDAAARSRDDADALKEYTAAIEIAKDAEVLAKLGGVYERLGDVPKAINAYEQALMFQPGNAQARAGLARLKAGR